MEIEVPEKPPYFPFYPKDFITDEVVMNMCTEAIGAYIRLLCAAWIANPPATIPTDDAALSRLAGVSPQRWEELKAQVLPAWSPTKTGRYTQRRLAFEYHKADRKIRANRENGKRGGRPSSSGEETQGLATASSSLTHRAHNQTRTRIRPEKNQPPPTVDDARALAGYAAEVCFTNPGAVEVGKLLKVFGVGTVVSVFQHLASRDPGHWDTVRNPLALVRSLCNQVRDGDELETQGEFESFADWRARREADVAAVGEKP